MKMKINWHLLLLVLLISLSVNSKELTEAAKHGDLDTVISLIASGVDVNQLSADGTTALAHATWRNDLAMLNYLLINAEAEVNIANDYGATALYLAAEIQMQPL